MGYLVSLAQKFIAVSVFSSALVWSTYEDLAIFLETRLSTHRKFLATTLAVAFFVFLAGSGSAQGQTATVNWTDVHQVIDGFGASNESQGGSMSSANQAFFFGTGNGQLGLSLLRVGVTDGQQDGGDCTSVSTSCAGVYVSDMQAVIANGGRVYASPWSPPAIYKTNGSTHCTAGGGGGALASADYASYATWMANFVKSLQTEYGIPLYAISVQNEPDQCGAYDTAVWSAADIDTFIKTNLGPTFAADGLSTLIFAPEGANYSSSNGLGSTCGTDSSCYNHVGGFNWHDYQASMSGTNTVAANPYPSGWPSGKKYWQTEASCGSGYGPSFCETQASFHADMTTDGLGWAALIDQRIAGDNANSWFFWQTIDYDYGGPATSTDGSLMANVAGGSAVAKRAYVLGQYAKFVRPGYYRIDATRQPQTGVSVSAFQDTPSSTLDIIATNYTGSPVSQTFNITNAPTFSTLTPTITSASLSLAAQSNVSVSGNSFTYTLPADSITTFVGRASIPLPPTNLTSTVLQ